ncbi:MAG: hypothetical protein ISS33_00585 [Candidatus Omnitrophica bacterium]|nr:hypothetical protein [Candidatus Omnitrophota bacterium]
MNEKKTSSYDEERALIGKLRRIEALFAGTNFEGEKKAAKNALERIRGRLRKIRKTDSPVEFKFSFGDMWSRRLFVSLCRRYDIDTYRYSGQKHTTIMTLISKSFVDGTLCPEFQELNKTLSAHIDDITNRVIAEAIYNDSSEVEVRRRKRYISEIDSR